MVHTTSEGVDDKCLQHIVYMSVHSHLLDVWWTYANGLFPVVQVGDCWIYDQKAIIFIHLFHNYDSYYYAITDVAPEYEIQRKTHAHV